MRALPVPRDTIDLLVTAAFISSTDAAAPGAPLTLIAEGRDPRLVLGGADRMGQLLWDENYASVSFAEKCHATAPRYEWRPVAELLGAHVDAEQILQIERSRLYLVETSCHHMGWDGSAAEEFVQRLGKAVEAQLLHHPIVMSPEIPGVIEYDGLSRAVDDWQRTTGFRNVLDVSAAQRLIRGAL